MKKIGNVIMELLIKCSGNQMVLVVRYFKV